MYFLELGGEDDAFAAWEARSGATGLRRIAPGLAVARGLDVDRINHLAYTKRASKLIGRTDADVESARFLLEAASFDPSRKGSVAVRATDVRGSTGIDTGTVERALGTILVDRGYTVDLDDPDHVLRAVFAHGSIDRRRDECGDLERVRFDSDDDSPPETVSVCILGWLVAESIRDFGSRMPTEKPFFQPGSMDPLLARAVVNIAGARPGVTLLDPLCGTGGILVEAGLVGATVIGSDVQRKMVEGTRANLAHFLGTEEATDDDDGSPPAHDESLETDSSPTFHVFQADSSRLPVRPHAVDAVVFDAPYGRQSTIESHSLETLIAETLVGIDRLCQRAILVADRPWIDVALDAGWTPEAIFERRVHRSLTRYVHVLTDSSSD